VEEGADEVIFEDAYGARVAKKGNICLFLATEPCHELLSELIKQSGAKSIIPTEGVVHGNSKMLGVFSTREKGICGCVSLPQKTDWVEWFTKKEYHDTDQAEISIGTKEARVFIAKELL